MLKLGTRLPALASLLACQSIVYAGTAAKIPEPGVLELAGIGAAVAIAIALHKRRK